MNLAFTILTIFVFISLIILLLFHNRKSLGLAPLFILLGAIQYFQTVLARGYNINLFDSLKISPGSVILFSSTLFALLLVYIKEGVLTTRSLIFGIVIANLSIGLFSVIVSSQIGLPANLIEILPDSKRFLTINFRIFIVGSLTLLLDFYLTVIVYKLLVTKFTRIHLFPAIFTTLLVVLSFDSVLFVIGSFYNTPGYSNILLSHLAGKAASALFFSTVLYLYLKFTGSDKTNPVNFIADQSNDLWSIITYRQKYETLKAEKETVEKEMAFKLDSALDSMTDGFITLDRNWKYTYVNKNASEILKKTKEEMIGARIEEGFTTEGFSYFQKKYLPVYEQALQQQRYTYLEEYYQSVDRWYENHLYPSADGISIYFREITARKKAEQALEENRLQLKFLSDNLPYSYMYQLVITPKEETILQFLSSNIKSITGKKVEELMCDPKALLHHVHEDDLPALVKATNESRERVSPISMEIRFVTHTKDVRNMLIRALPRKLQDGSILWDGIYTDITDLQKAEQEKQELSNRNNQIISFMLDGFIVGDLQGNIIDVNEAYCNMTGYSRRELMTKKIFEIDNLYTKEELRVLTKKLLAEKSLKLETQHLKKDGDCVIFEVSITLMPFNGQELVAAFFRDITDKNKAQQQIRNYNTQLSQLTAHLQSVREEERRRIGREIHDDLGQRLTAIKMDAAWINKKIDEEQVAVKEKISNILELLDGSNMAVRRILNELKPSILDEYGLLEAIEAHAHQFTENTGIPVEINAPEQVIELDEELATCIFRVFQECLTNITRYAKADIVHTRITTGANTIEVSVQDNGVGFSFEQLMEKQSFGIMGMRERIRANAGFFDISSEVGKGTTVTFVLPMQHKTV